MLSRRSTSMAAYATAIHAPRGLTAHQGMALNRLATVGPVALVRCFSTSQKMLDQKKPDQEELDELAREAKLRQRFANKQQESKGVFGNMFGSSGSSSTDKNSNNSESDNKDSSSSSTASSTSSSSNTGESMPGEVVTKIGPFKFVKRKIPAGGRGPAGGMTTTEILIWFLSMYTLVIYYLSWDPRRRSWHGIEWWAQPVDTTACWLLAKLILPSRDQGPIRQQFFNMSKSNQTISFGQYVAQYHPHVMDGNTYSQAEIVAAMIAVLANTDQLTFAAKLAGKTFTSNDSKKNADAIMEALKTDYSHLFSAPAMGGGMMMGGGQEQQQQMMYQSQMMVQQQSGGQPPSMMMSGSTPAWGGVQVAADAQAPVVSHDFSGATTAASSS